LKRLLPTPGSNAELLMSGFAIGVKRPAFIPSSSIVYSKRNGEKKNVLLNNSSNTFNRFKKTSYGFFRPPENKLRSNSRLKSSSSSKFGNNSVNSKLVINKLVSSKLGNNKL